ncbi:hypothetical protein [Baekduia soli]|uniref:hypothetical protein n=1 Tax=Baekduia soli TaxID=496014 RepID=UPI001651D99F|nr:hypothetical protein [Baekduia soli]
MGGTPELELDPRHQDGAELAATGRAVQRQAGGRQGAPDLVLHARGALAQAAAPRPLAQRGEQREDQRAGQERGHAATVPSSPVPGSSTSR